MQGVYFVSSDKYVSENEIIVKIGWSKNIEKRIKAHQTSNPYDLKLYAVIETTNKSLEKRLHEQFSIFNLKGEWFKIPNDQFPEIINSNNGKILEEIFEESSEDLDESDEDYFDATCLYCDTNFKDKLKWEKHENNCETEKMLNSDPFKKYLHNKFRLLGTKSFKNYMMISKNYRYIDIMGCDVRNIEKRLEALELATKQINANNSNITVSNSDVKIYQKENP